MKEIRLVIFQFCSLYIFTIPVINNANEIIDSMAPTWLKVTLFRNMPMDCNI